MPGHVLGSGVARERQHHVSPQVEGYDGGGGGGVLPTHR